MLVVLIPIEEKPKRKEIVYFQNILYRKSFPIHLIKKFLEEKDAVINMTENNERLKQDQIWFNFSLFGKERNYLRPKKV